MLDTHYDWPGKFAILSNLTLTHNLTGVQPLSNPLWSLPYEVQMYLLLPAIFVFLAVKQWPLRLALLMGAAMLASSHVALAAFVPNFLCGVLAYCLMQSVRPRLPAWLCPVIILGAMTGYCILSSNRENSIARNTALCLVLGATLPLFRDTRYRPVQIVAHRIASRLVMPPCCSIHSSQCAPRPWSWPCAPSCTLPPASRICLAPFAIST